MSNLSIPLRIGKGRLDRTDNTRKSIDSAIALLMATTCGDSPADPEYGFIFNNLKFEIFNESEGVVYDSAPEESGDPDGLYDKKLTGSSSNLNTFAAELREKIEIYEKRLTDVKVSMTYARQERKIYVTVKGKIISTGKGYQYSTVINVWK